MPKAATNVCCACAGHWTNWWWKGSRPPFLFSKNWCASRISSTANIPSIGLKNIWPARKPDARASRMGISIILGLLAAFLYGTANFTVRPACQAAGIFRTMLYGQWLAVPFLTFAILIRGLPHAPWATWGVLIASDLVLLAATGLVCRALSRGRIKVAAPIAASYGGVAALLSALTGEALAPSGWSAIALITLGCILAAGRDGETREPGTESGAFSAAGAALLFGLAYWLQGRFVIPQLGTLAPVWSYYVLGAMLMPLVARVCGISLKPP